MGVGIRHNRLVVVLPDLCGGQLDNKYKPKKCHPCACALKHGPKNYKYVSLKIGGKGQKPTTHVVWSVVCLCFNGLKNYKCKSKKMWGRLKMCGVLAQ